MPDFEEISATFQNHHRDVFCFFLVTTLVEPTVAASLTQECMTQAYSGRRVVLSGTHGRVHLMSIAVKLVRKHFRYRRLAIWRRPAPDSGPLYDFSEWLPDAGLSTDQLRIARAQVRTIASAVSTFPLPQRIVFLLRFVEEFSLSEIIEATEMPLAEVHSLLNQSVSILRQELAKMSANA